MNKSCDIQSIDVHAHYGEAVDNPFDLVNRLMTADAGKVAEIAERSGTQYSIVSPLAAFYTSKESEVLAANLDASQMTTRYEGLYHWVVVNPLMPETFAQAKELLNTPRCLGMKVHPELHGYNISELGESIFAFAVEHGAVMKSHSGCVKSQPMDFVPFADRYPEARLIVAHLGHGHDGDITHQVRAIKSCKHGNIFTDTSSAKSIFSNLLEWAVGEIGAEKILFGTDSPLYSASMQRARVDSAEITEEDKKLILRDNALRLFSGKLT